METLDTDEKYMRRAIALARRGRGKTSPNPMVGAVIVKDGRIIGVGYHRRFGGEHAEINAIESTGEDVAGATLYVTLEPCHHYGKTPPCVDAIISHRLGSVVIGTADPNPLVAGRSIKKLEEHGISARTGVLAAACRALNEPFFTLMERGTPLVTVKFAQTLDGRIAAAGGDSQWLSSPDARRFAHRLRAESDAVMVGSGTVLADDPRLTVRLVRGRNPLRVIVDSTLKTSLESRITDTSTAATLIATTKHADAARMAALKAKGVEILVLDADKDGVSLKELLAALGKRGVSSLLVEGGAKIITTLLRQRLADRIIAVITPKIMGKGIETVGDLGIKEAAKAIQLGFTRSYRRGEDIIIEASLKPD